MKFPFLTELGRDAGSVRVGPLARMNVTHTLSTPLAQQALEQLPRVYRRTATNNMTLHTNWARRSKIIHAADDRQRLASRSRPAEGRIGGHPCPLMRGPVRESGWWKRRVAALLHHYRADREGNMTFANLIVATTQNNQVLNRTVR